MINEYTEFNEIILQTWIDNGVGYITVIPLEKTDDFQDLKEHKFQVTPSIQNTPGDPDVYSVSSDEIALFAANAQEDALYLVHQSDL